MRTKVLFNSHCFGLQYIAKNGIFHIMYIRYILQKYILYLRNHFQISYLNPMDTLNISQSQNIKFKLNICFKYIWEYTHRYTYRYIKILVSLDKNWKFGQHILNMTTISHFGKAKLPWSLSIPHLHTRLYLLFLCTVLTLQPLVYRGRCGAYIVISVYSSWSSQQW